MSPKQQKRAWNAPTGSKEAAAQTNDKPTVKHVLTCVGCGKEFDHIREPNEGEQPWCRECQRAWEKECKGKSETWAEGKNAESEGWGWEGWEAGAGSAHAEGTTEGDEKPY